MGDPIQRAGAAPGAHPVGDGPRARARNGRAFSAVLGDDGPGQLTEALRGAARSITRGEHLIDRAIRSARAGRVFSHEELLALQAGVYRYTQELELASKLVDKATSAVRTTLQSQQ